MPSGGQTLFTHKWQLLKGLNTDSVFAQKKKMCLPDAVSGGMREGMDPRPDHVLCGPSPLNTIHELQYLSDTVESAWRLLE